MKKHTIISILIVYFVLILNAAAQDKVQKIDEYLTKCYEYGLFNGSALVSEHGKVILNKGYGYANLEWDIPVTPDTKFRLGSVTKQFTAMLIMQLVEKGKVSLEGKLSEYLPYYRKDIADKVTIHNLLTHTSGIPGYTEIPNFLRDVSRDPYEVKDVIEKFCSDDLIFEPGTKYSYSNSGYFILGAVIEHVTGKSYEAVLKENILDPLGMNSSGYDHSEQIINRRASGYQKTVGAVGNAPYLDMSLPYAAGAMYSTVEDLFKWDQALYTDKLITNQSKEKMFTPFLSNYAYGWSVLEVMYGDVKKKVSTHSGGINGFVSLIVRFSEDKITIILLSNVIPTDLRLLGKAIGDILYNQPYEMPKKSLAEILAKAINEKGIEQALNDFNSLKEKKSEYGLDENEMNQLGYQLLGAGKVKEAIEVFKLNTEAFPKSFNVWDSLGEAYMISGDKENAIKYYKKSLEINPDSRSGKEALKELEGK